MPSLWNLVDLYACCGVVLFAERRRLNALGHRFYVTPVLAFVGSVAVVYLIPITAAAKGYTSLHFLPARLSGSDLGALVQAVRIFLYSFTAVYLLLLPALPGKTKANFERPVPSKNVLRRMAALVLVIWLLHLMTGVELSPSAIVARAIHPREYTYLRSGTGLLVYLRAAAFLVMFVLLGLRIVWARERKRPIKGLILVFVGFVILDVLGGSKQSLIVGPLALLYLWGLRGTSMARQEDDAPVTTGTPGNAVRQPARVPTRSTGRTGLALFRYAGAGVLVSVLLWVAFGLMQTAESHATNETVIGHMISYDQEAYYSARVIEDYPPNLYYAKQGLEDVFRGAVPRSLVAEKGPVGFYARYWHDEYTPNAVSYQATTFGALAEAHMMFGNWGFILYGSGFALLMIWMYRLQFSRKSWFSICLGAFFIQWMYFIVRAGVTGSAMLYILVEIALIAAFTRVCRPRRASADAASMRSTAQSAQQPQSVLQ